MGINQDGGNNFFLAGHDEKMCFALYVYKKKKKTIKTKLIIP